MDKLHKIYMVKDLIKFKKKLDKVNIKDCSPRINTLNENPVVTQEKEKKELYIVQLFLVFYINFHLIIIIV